MDDGVRTVQNVGHSRHVILNIGGSVRMWLCYTHCFFLLENVVIVRRFSKGNKIATV